MEIRSVTVFCEPTADPAQTADFLTAVRQAFPYPVQSTRIATTPFPDWWPPGDEGDESATAAAQTLVGQWQAAGANYVSLGPVQLRHAPAWLEMVPALLTATDSLFVSAEIADVNGRLDIGRIHQVASLIQRVSASRDNGFGNLYLAALANCPPGSPFFPVAYHQGGPAAFAVAVEAADLALSAVQGSATLAEARAGLIAAIEHAATAITQTAERLADAYQLPFRGIDFSLAPYPTAERSLAAALEALGLPHLGAPGSLFAAAFITEAIDRADFRRCGFSGLMLPVLEDSVLAQRAGEGVVTVNDLLGYAAVCGVGLDTIPLPGDISQAALAGILLDVAALATRLNKPLTARLMPLPGLAAGDPVRFDFPYFADGRVMGPPSRGIGRFLAQPGPLQLNSRRPSAPA
jgi:uncharacterized protein